MKRMLRMQPTFTLELPQQPDELITAIRAALTTQEQNGTAQSAGNCVDFKVHKSERRFWSPHLSVQISDTPQGSQVFGRYSPRPEVWTMFMAIYAVTAACIIGSLIYGYVQWFLNTRPWALAIAPMGILTIIGLHVSSLIGQRLSDDQMQQLRQRLDQALQHVQEPD